MNTIRFSVILFISFLITSCGEDIPTTEVEVPTNYTFTRNAESTVSFSGQTTRILMATELINAMNDFDLNEETLLEMYRNEKADGSDANPFAEANLNESSKSIRSKVAASQDFFLTNTAEAIKIKAEFESWITAQISEIVPNQLVAAEPGVAGQIADGTSVRYVNGKGLEYNQAVNKGLIGGLMVDQMLNNYLGTAVLDAGTNIEDNDNEVVVDGSPYTSMEHKWDEAYGYLFGLSIDQSDPLATLGDDSFLNKYLARVDNDVDFSGIASTIYNAFKTGRAAIVAQDYNLRNVQANIIRDEVSKLIAIRAVYYLQQGKNQLPDSGSDYGPAFHDLSEGFGFVYSLRFTRKSDRNEPYFTAEEVDTFIGQLTVGNGFWDITPTTLDEMSDAIAAKFNFTIAEAAD